MKMVVACTSETAESLILEPHGVTSHKIVRFINDRSENFEFNSWDLNRVRQIFYVLKQLS